MDILDKFNNMEGESEERSFLTAKLAKYTTNILFAVVALLFAYPLYYLFITSTLPLEAMFQFPPRLLPGKEFLTNYELAIFTQQSGLPGDQAEISRAPFVPVLINTLVFVVGSMLLTVSIATLAGYAFAKFDFTGKAPLFYTAISLMAIPFQLLTIPLFNVMQKLSLIDSFWGLLLPTIAGPFAVFFMKQQIETTIVDSLLESARMDGASELQILRHIVFPMTLPAIAALAVLVFLFRINMLFWPLAIIQTPEKQVATVYLTGLRGATYPTPWRVMMPLAFIVTLPSLAIFFLMQEQFIKGFTGAYLKQ